MNRGYRTSLFLILVLGTSGFCQPLPVSASGEVLQGTIRQQEYMRQQGPALTRTDINQAGDPFSGDKPGGNSMEAFDAPDSAFQGTGVGMPPPPPKRPLTSQVSHTDDFQGKGGNALPDQMPGNPGNQQVASKPQPDPNDPDSSHEMQVAWDAWHKRLAAAIYEQYKSATTLGGFTHGRPLAAQVVYTVTNTGKIINVQLVQKSPNMFYNAMLICVVNSMNGSPILQFPEGSKRQTVEKSGTFAQNYGADGFKYTINDIEHHH